MSFSAAVMKCCLSNRLTYSDYLKMHKDILQRALEIIHPDTGMEFPPKVFTDMGGEFINFVEDHH